jgi:branched-chain amino acid transport system substrate-binding protein
MKGFIGGIVCFVTLIVSTALAADSIKIGFLYILSGRVGQFGQIASQGAEVAIDEINRSGGLNGRFIKGIFADTKANPDTAIDEAKKLVKEQKVDALIGIISSRVASAVAPEMKALKTPLIITTALTPNITGRDCNRYTFRITSNLPAIMKTAALLAAKRQAKTWTTIGPDYSLGHVSWDLFQKNLSQLKPGVRFSDKRDVVFAPLKTRDWVPFVEKLKKTKADGVLISLWGGNFIDFVRQANELNLFDGKREYLASVVSFAAVLGLRSDMPPDIWMTPPYNFEASAGEANKRFVEAYRRRYKIPPSYQAQFAYSGVKAYAEAVKLAGSTDKEAVVQALEGLTMELPVGEVTIRAEDHQAVFDGLAGKSAKRFSLTKTRRPYRGLEWLIRFSSSEIFPSPEETGCRMNRK